jgi:hypothetical protein
LIVVSALGLGVMDDHLGPFSTAGRGRNREAEFARFYDRLFSEAA